jgi:hypothetical protein
LRPYRYKEKSKKWRHHRRAISSICSRDEPYLISGIFYDKSGSPICEQAIGVVTKEPVIPEIGKCFNAPDSNWIFLLFNDNPGGSIDKVSGKLLEETVRVWERSAIDELLTCHFNFLVDHPCYANPNVSPGLTGLKIGAGQN